MLPSLSLALSLSLSLSGARTVYSLYSVMEFLPKSKKNKTSRGGGGEWSRVDTKLESRVCSTPFMLHFRPALLAREKVTSKTHFQFVLYIYMYTYICSSSSSLTQVFSLDQPALAIRTLSSVEQGCGLHEENPRVESTSLIESINLDYRKSGASAEKSGVRGETCTRRHCSASRCRSQTEDGRGRESESRAESPTQQQKRAWMPTAGI